NNITNRNEMTNDINDNRQSELNDCNEKKKCGNENQKETEILNEPEYIPSTVMGKKSREKTPINDSKELANLNVVQTKSETNRASACPNTRRALPRSSRLDGPKRVVEISEETNEQTEEGRNIDNARGVRFKKPTLVKQNGPLKVKASPTILTGVKK